MQAHKREKVTGVSYKIINVFAESGASSPSTPIGINLPNAEWIREHHTVRNRYLLAILKKLIVKQIK